MKIHLTNQSGMLKEFDWGFSWKVFFFGGFVPLFRGDIKGFLIATFLVFATFGLYWPYFAFVYNKKYVASFLEKGFYPADEASRNTLTASGLIMGMIPTNPPPTSLGNEAPRQINGKQAEITPVQQPEGKDNPHLRYRDIFPEKCPGCGTPRAEGFSFCGTCGNKLEVLKRQAICAVCGNDVDDSAEKCPSCGQLLVEKPSPAELWECKACGMQNMVGDSFCGKCGTRSGADEGQATQVSIPNSVGNRLEPSNSQSTSFLLIAVVGVLCAIAVFYFVTQQRESQSMSVAKTPVTTNTPTTQLVTPQTAQEEEDLFEEESVHIIFDDPEPMVVVLKGKNINIRSAPSVKGKVVENTSNIDQGAYLADPRPIYDSASNMNWYHLTYYFGPGEFGEDISALEDSRYISASFVELSTLNEKGLELYQDCVIRTTVDNAHRKSGQWKVTALGADQPEQDTIDLFYESGKTEATVYSDSDMNSPKVATLPGGTPITYSHAKYRYKTDGKREIWVRLLSPVEGWVPASYVGQWGTYLFGRLEYY